ncbi:hypothetical protein H0H93_010592 [Arthromyces matolae]|nr:hypothetical protein H0H93_010592 [Arthromyces matolae]
MDRSYSSHHRTLSPKSQTVAVPGFLKGYVRRFAQKSHDHRGTPEVRIADSFIENCGDRSVMQSPGRVVTLIHKEDWDKFSSSDPFPDDDVVWGVAYTIDPPYEAEVRDYLDYREKDGYTMESVDIYGIDGDKEVVVIPKAICYVGRDDNPSFGKQLLLRLLQSVLNSLIELTLVGSEPLDLLAQRIWSSVGPSGKNKGVVDSLIQDYLYNLARAIKDLSPNSHDSHLSALEQRVRALDSQLGL